MYQKSPFPEVPDRPALNVHHLFFNRPDQRNWPDYTLHIDTTSGKRTKFREFLNRVRDGATALVAPVSQGGLDIRAEDQEIVGILSDNSSEYITLVHALLAITTPFVLLSSFSTPLELTHAIRLSKATRLFVQPRLLPLALQVAQETDLSDEKICIIGGHFKGKRSFGEIIEHTRNKNVKQTDVRSAGKDTLAYLVFSSGTTGPPKAVMISHGNVAFSIYQTILLSEEKCPPPNIPEGIPIQLCFLPMHHVYGLHVYSFRCFMAPTTLVILPKWNIDVALDMIPRYRVTTIGLIPSIIHQLVTHPNIKDADLSSLVAVSSGAAYLPAKLAKKFKCIAPKGLVLSEGYGMSEATLGAMIKPFPGIRGGFSEAPDSTWILAPGMEARIVRNDGSDAGVNEFGELWLRGQNIALGYWNDEKANKETFVNGWLRTGDRFRVDESRYFFFGDRTKDTLKVSGMQVSPVEIENVLLTHPDKLITDATVAGVSGGRTSDELVPRAWVVLSNIGRKHGERRVVQLLHTHIRLNLSKYKWLRGGIQVTAEIPKTPTGKVLRRVLQQQYEQNMCKSEIAESKL